MLLVNGVCQRPAPETRIELGLHKGAEVLFGSTFAYYPYLFFQDPARILGG